MSEEVRGRRDIVLYLLQRFGWGLLVIWLVLSATWVMVQLKPERSGGLGGPGASPESSPSLLTQYLTWVGDYLTLNWGQSVLETWATAAPVTLAYLLPSLIFATLIGVGLATYGAVRPGGLIDRFVSGLSYMGVSVPTFVIAELTILIGIKQLGIYRVYNPNSQLLAYENVVGFTLPAAILTVSLVGIVARYSRNESLSHLNREFVKTAKSKGAGRLRLAAHVFRNAWLALAQLLFSETVGLLFLGTIVLEQVFSLPGIASAIFQGFQEPNEPLVISAALVAVVIGVIGTWIQDIGRVFLMPVDDQ
ncbi:MAG: ABC transporter permease [Halodesulfurarchaeum sp.]